MGYAHRLKLNIGDYGNACSGALIDLPLGENWKLQVWPRQVLGWDRYTLGEAMW